MNGRELVGFETVLNDKVRLSILVTLAAAREPIDFSTLREELQLTRGNLSSHIRRLEEAKLVSVNKEFVDRKPRTTYVCTDLGRRELSEYLSKIEMLIKSIG